MPGTTFEGGKIYLKIIGGNLVQEVTETTEGAVLRKYELKDGTKGEKWEKQFINWTGFICGITFKDTQFGKFCNIDLGDAVLTLGTESRYFKDFGCKVSNLDFSKEVTFHPFDFEVDGKRKTGISIKQGGEKIGNYFYDYEKKEALYDFPQPDNCEDSDDWKIYFAQVKKFLVKHIENNIETPELKIEESKTTLPEKDEIDISDLPF